MGAARAALSSVPAGVGGATLQDVADTVQNHLERCREEIATGERMLEALRRDHGIIPEGNG